MSKAITPLVLVAESHPDVRETLATALTLEGLRVAQASTSASALGLSIGEPPDLIIIEHTLPGGGAVELLRRLQDDARTRTTTALVMTRDPDAHDDLRRSGFVLVLVKPFDAASMIEKVLDLAGGWTKK